jgi:hypothetical protein
MGICVVALSHSRSRNFTESRLAKIELSEKDSRVAILNDKTELPISRFGARIMMSNQPPFHRRRTAEYSLYLYY